MADAESHLKKAKANQEFADEAYKRVCDPSNNYYDWVVTTYFYAAVHYLRALLAHHGIWVEGRANDVHYNQFSAKLQQVCGRSEEVSKVSGAFDELKELSQEARYQCLAQREYLEMVTEAEDLCSEVRRFVEKHLPTSLAK